VLLFLAQWRRLRTSTYEPTTIVVNTTTAISRNGKSGIPLLPLAELDELGLVKVVELAVVALVFKGEVYVALVEVITVVLLTGTVPCSVMELEKV
jgi:hypothetical protein